jgi:hypothetical protein
MPGKAPLHSEEWKDKYADNKRKDYMLMQVTRIADALDRAYPPPEPEPILIPTVEVLSPPPPPPG